MKHPQTPKPTRPVVLFTRPASVYRSLGADVWDINRDATKYNGLDPVIAHPPCRAWGRYHHWSKHSPKEAELARFSVSVIQRNGGILEHPQYSRLWRDRYLPFPDQFLDDYGGYTISINQSAFGHRALKPTWLYIVGLHSTQLPILPLDRAPTATIENMGRSERERTPIKLALWLIDALNQIKASRSLSDAQPEPHIGSNPN